jgi:serine/threonine-protein kinase HipA
MFDAVNNYISPGERLKLLDAVIFNVLICYSDSHAKNYSALIGAGGSARMAPLYDLMCAAVYGDVDQHLPQNIGGKFTAAELHGKDWKSFSEAMNLSPASTSRRIEELASRVEQISGRVAQEIIDAAGDPGKVLERITHQITNRCRRIRRQL